MANFSPAFNLSNNVGYTNVYSYLDADFSPAFSISKVNEGGYVNDVRDLGGETYRGVARKFHPEWSGWAVIDAMKKKKAIPKFYTDATLDKHAEAFYKKQYWNNMLGDLIDDQQNANQIYDHTLSGLPRAGAMVKHLLNSKFGAKLDEKANFSLAAIEALNKADQKKFFDLFKQYRTKMFLYSAGALPKSDSLFTFFQRFNKADDAKRKANGGWALKGWLYRVNKYNYTGGASGGTSIFKSIALITVFWGSGWFIEKKLFIRKN